MVFLHRVRDRQGPMVGMRNTTRELLASSEGQVMSVIRVLVNISTRLVFASIL